MRLGRAVGVVVAVSVAASGAGCRPVNPPNALTAMLRAVPLLGQGPLVAVRFFDFAQARKDLDLPPEAGLNSFPLSLKQAGTRLAHTPLGRGSLFETKQLEAVLEVTPTGAQSIVMLVGSFDSARAFTTLDSWGWPSTESGLFKLYRSPDGSGLGIGPRRLVFSMSYDTAEAVTAFRGGPDSLLSLDGLASLAVSAGRPAAFGAAIPEKACLDPRWMAVAVKFLPNSPPASALVVEYRDPDTAAASRKRIQAGLASYLAGSTSRIEVVDARRDTTVASISTDDSGAAQLLADAYRGSRLERVLEC